MSNENKLGEAERIVGESAHSHSIQQTELKIGFVPPPKDGVQFTYKEVVRAYDEIPKLLENWEDIVVQKTQELLRANEATTASNHDDIFAYFTDYIVFCNKSFLAQRARRLWRDRISILVDESEARLKTANLRIHRGAPLYNVGLCSFSLGDFDRAIQFMAEAGYHDELLGRGNRVKVLLGDHPLSEQVILNPLSKLIAEIWAPDYIKITGFHLDNNELKFLFRSLADRPSDAIQAIVALHRLARTLAGPQNQGVSIIRYRAFAELLHLVESFLRHFQTTVSGQLDAHLTALAETNDNVKNARASFSNDYTTEINAGRFTRHSVDAMNWISTQTASRIQSAATPPKGTGAAIFFCHQFRNSALHVNEENLAIFQSKDLCVRAVGWVLGMLRSCARAKEGKFSATDFT